MARRGYEIEWLGDEVTEMIVSANEAAVHELAQEAADLAEAEAPRDRGHLARSMHAEAPVTEGDDVYARWGADKAMFYAAAVEALHPTKAGFMRRIHDRVSAQLAEQIAGRVD